MTTRPTGRCEACRFFERTEATDQGYCRRRAPQPGFVINPATPVELMVGAWPAWPAVGLSEWCGEFVATAS